MFDPAGPFYYKYAIKFVKLKAGHQCLPSDLPACVTSINSHIPDKRHDKLLTGYYCRTSLKAAPLVNNSAWTLSPGVVACETDNPTQRGWHQQSSWKERWQRGRDQWSGMSPPEKPAGGVYLPVLWCPPSRTDTIWPAGMLLSKGGGVGLMLPPTLTGGWVRAEH